MPYWFAQYLKDERKQKKSENADFYKENLSEFSVEMEGGREVGVLLDLSQGSPLYT